jgi:hypothetical protein
MVIELDDKIVVGGSSGGATTFIRYNLDGSVDTLVRQRQRRPAADHRNAERLAAHQRHDRHDARPDSGTILVAGFGGSQSMFVARSTAAGRRAWPPHGGRALRMPAYNRGAGR